MATTGFKNVASSEKADDLALAAELQAAGIPFEKLPESLRKGGEVKTIVLGALHGWTFTRAWYYWIAEGPGIPHEEATDLWNLNLGVRVDGHCANPSPLEWFKGLAVGYYHVDTAEGLKALADTIKSLVEKAQPLKLVEPAKPEGHCEQMKKPGGCQLHNLHCGYPKCNEPKK